METRLAAAGRRMRPPGRANECGVLERLVAVVRGGESRSLVLRGEAGIGKTALLEYLIDSASEMTALRAAGVESEMELTYAGFTNVRADARAAPATQRDRAGRVRPDRFRSAGGPTSVG
jgi:AAA ATPase domain